MPRRVNRLASVALGLSIALAGGGMAGAQDDDGPLARPSPVPPEPSVRPDFSGGLPQGPAPEGVLPQPGGYVPFLFINQERILTGSIAGKAILAEEDGQRDTLRAEARALDKSFEDEERKLTEQRPTMPPEEFRKLSDAFDARVVQARRDQDNRATTLAQEFDQRRRQFYAQVAPILVSLMERYGARAIFDESSVLLADQSLNITQAVIGEIDARAAETEPPDAPAPTPGPDTGQGPAADENGGN